MNRIATFLLLREWDMTLGLLILLVGGCYAWGLLAVWRQAGVGHGITRGQALRFALGVLTLLAALASPLHPLGEMLFTAHMVQHLLLVVVAAPLLLLGAPAVALAWALPPGTRRPLAQWWQRCALGQQVVNGLLHPLVAGWLFGLTLWLWHVPALYEAALHNQFWHAAEHSTLLITALLFWGTANPTSTANAQRRGYAILLLFATAMHSGLLGALLTFATTPWYPSYQRTSLLWGITPLADQQLAGVLMWWPMGLVFGAGILWQVAQWLHTPGEEVRTTKYA